MKIVFRVDASLKIGSGHIVRCLTLAKELEKQGAKCRFLCRDLKGNLIKKIRQENFDVTVFPFSKKAKSFKENNNTNLTYSSWLSVSWMEDVKQTIDSLKTEKIDLLIVDHYGIGKQWEKKIRPYVKKIMVIDDLANRQHDCDLLLDQNLVSNFKTRYKNLLPKYCRTLLGPEFAILQNNYKDFHVNSPVRTGPIKRILVYFGNIDLNNLIELTISAFNKLNRKNITLDIVTGFSSSSKNKIKKLSNKNKNKNIIFHSNLSSLASLMLKADIAIGACGVTTWERCCLGLPSIVITMAENQKKIAKELDKLGIIQWLDHYDKITNERIYGALESLIDQNIETWSNTCKLITDGSGTQKVSSILSANHKVRPKLRLAKFQDDKLLFNWANDPLVRSNAFNSKTINKTTHKEWFQSRINNKKNCVIYILETKEKVPIGQVRFEKKNKIFYINYSLDSFVRGKNIGYIFLKKAIKKFKQNRRIRLIAEVKRENLASCKVFEKIGFRKSLKVKYGVNIFSYKL